VDKVINIIQKKKIKIIIMDLEWTYNLYKSNTCPNDKLKVNANLENKGYPTALILVLMSPTNPSIISFLPS
jgi:hypothetical protein